MIKLQAVDTLLLLLKLRHLRHSQDSAKKMVDKENVQQQLLFMKQPEVIHTKNTVTMLLEEHTKKQ